MITGLALAFLIAYLGMDYKYGLPLPPTWVVLPMVAVIVVVLPVHELGHVCAGRTVGLRWLECRAWPPGVVLSGDPTEKVSGTRTRRQQVVASAGGPVGSLLSAAVLAVVLLPTVAMKPAAASVGVALAHGLVNCLPISWLDGGRLHAAWKGTGPWVGWEWSGARPAGPTAKTA